MREGNKRWFRSVGTMIGAIIGIGVFGIPYAFAQAGFFVGLIQLIVVGILLVMLQLLYAEVTIQTPGHRRTTGLAEKYLGKKWKYLLALTVFGTAWGAMMAYIIVAGEFLYTLLGPSIGGSPFIYSVGFMIIESLFLLAGLRKIAGAETYVVVILLLLFGSIIALGLPNIELANLTMVDGFNMLLPYGVVLFALGGLSIVPEMHDILGEKYEKRIRSAIVVAMSVIVVIYALFALAVVGVTGVNTTDEAILGLGRALGPAVSVIGSLLGLITLVSIFVIVGIQIKDTLIFDFKLRPFFAWVLTIGIPITLFLLGVREFISVMAFSGAVFSAMTGVVIVLVFEKLRRTVCTRRKCFVLPKWISYLLAGIFIAGAILQILYTIFK